MFFLFYFALFFSNIFHTNIQIFERKNYWENTYLEKGKIEGKIKSEKEMLKDNEPTWKTIKYTGLTENQINEMKPVVE